MLFDGDMSFIFKFFLKMVYIVHLLLSNCHIKSSAHSSLMSKDYFFLNIDRDKVTVENVGSIKIRQIIAKRCFHNEMNT